MKSQEHLVALRRHGEQLQQVQPWSPPRDGEFYLSSQYFEREDGGTPVIQTEAELKEYEAAKDDMAALIRNPEVAKALSELVSPGIERDQRLAAAAIFLADLIPNKAPERGTQPA